MRVKDRTIDGVVVLDAGTNNGGPSGDPDSSMKPALLLVKCLRCICATGLLHLHPALFCLFCVHCVQLHLNFSRYGLNGL